jgi:Asp-tRNA(Asn)/Glu-tRNA(Gln) amidotransferase A subunit family amidase
MRDEIDRADLLALDARDRMARGEFSAADYAEAIIARIGKVENQIGAFTFFDAESVRRGAAERDAYRGAGRAPGMLHGLPVGVKDIVDTADMPTENGSALDAGRQPNKDAALVSRLRSAGAIIAGKTVSTEFAYFHPGKTRNPANLDHTPGGSSSGSAAAVAAGMVPLAIGSQTNGSVIRPASYCGVVGYKPTYGLISRTGMFMMSAPLDTVGVFARSVADVALLADALAGFDSADLATSPAPPPRLLETALSEPPVTPALSFVKSPAWESATSDTREGFAELVEALGERCSEVAPPDDFAESYPAHQRLMMAGMARHIAPYEARGRNQLSEKMQEALEAGRRITAVDYLTALDWRESLNTGLDRLFDHCDAVMTPAAPGEAPHGIDATGDPVFNGQWTLLGVPCITLPLLTGSNGLPIGVQLIGRRGDDARLLRTARWLMRHVDEELT